jgi:hypothetical protein
MTSGSPRRVGRSRTIGLLQAENRQRYRERIDGSLYRGSPEGPTDPPSIGEENFPECPTSSRVVVAAILPRISPIQKEPRQNESILGLTPEARRRCPDPQSKKSRNSVSNFELKQWIFPRSIGDRYRRNVLCESRCNFSLELLEHRWIRLSEEFDGAVSTVSNKTRDRQPGCNAENSIAKPDSLDATMIDHALAPEIVGLRIIHRHGPFLIAAVFLQCNRSR